MNIFVLNTLQTGIDVLRLIKDEIPIKGYFGLSQSRGREDVSGFVNAIENCKQWGIDYHELKSYNISKEEDKILLTELSIDVLLVLGWQRLIPEWLINECKVCAVGVHGSPLGIEKGRGRSPQNWGLIAQSKSFDISIFKITPGVDDGNVFDTASFLYEDSENIRSSYIKCSMLISSMLIDTYERNKFQEAGLKQHNDKAEYLPQRTYEDGQIDWNRSSQEIHFFIKALTKPYPGAFTKLAPLSIQCWSSVPFTTSTKFNKSPNGQIIDVLSGDEIVVKCKDGFVILNEHEISSNISATSLIGEVLESSNFEEQLRRIEERHITKNPSQPLSTLFKDLYPK